MDDIFVKLVHQQKNEECKWVLVYDRPARVCKGKGFLRRYASD
jgi:hypothetical protein